IDAAEVIIKDQRIDAIISTSPPRVAHLVANDIANRYDIPWIMDLRDPWYGSWASDLAGSRALTILYDELFHKLASRASSIILNTRRFRDHLCVSHPELCQKTCVIPNGYDSSTVISAGKSQAESTDFTIGYFGFIYKKRSAKTFFQGLRLWL